MNTESPLRRRSKRLEKHNPKYVISFISKSFHEWSIPEYDMMDYFDYHTYFRDQGIKEEDDILNEINRISKLEFMKV